MLSVKFKIIALCETAINDCHTCYNISGYTLEQDFRPTRKGGGVALYTANTLQYKVRSDLSIGGETNSIFVKIGKRYLKAKYNTIIGCIYRPPSYKLKSFKGLLTSKLAILTTENKHLYIADDFNVNTDPMIGDNGNTQNFKNTLSFNFLFPLINKPTRVTQHYSTIIDNIYCNTDKLADTCKSGIFRLSISDHYAIFCVNHNIHISDAKCTITKRNLLREISLDLINVLKNNHGYP